MKVVQKNAENQPQGKSPPPKGSWIGRFIQAIIDGLKTVACRISLLFHRKLVSETQIKKEPVPSPLKPEQVVVKKRLPQNLSDIEMRLIHLLRPELSPSDVRKAQAEAQTASPIEVLLSKCGISDGQNTQRWERAAETMEQAMNELKALVPVEVAEKPNQLSYVPDLAFSSLQKQQRNLIEQTIQRDVEYQLSKLKDPKLSLEEWLKELEPFKKAVESTVQLCKDFIQQRFDFYKDWGKFVKAEMIQGFHDEGEILGEGVCWALSLHWTVAELKKSDAQDVQDIIQEMNIGHASGRHRFEQALMLTEQGGMNAQAMDGIKKRLGIKESFPFDLGENLVGKEAIRESLRAFLQSPDWIANKGVGQLYFAFGDSAHAITVVSQPDSIDPSKSVFRFSDANFGTFHFPVSLESVGHQSTQNQMIDCLADLISTFYSSNINKLSCTCFSLS